MSIHNDPLTDRTIAPQHCDIVPSGRLRAHARTVPDTGDPAAARRMHRQFDLSNCIDRETRDQVNTSCWRTSPQVRTQISIYLPAAKAGTNSDPTTPQPVAYAAINLPSDKRYLYFKSDPWYSSSVEFDTNAMGLPSKSDTTSSQQVTNILGEVGRAAEELLAPGPKALSGIPNYKDQQWCLQAITQEAPYGQTFPVSTSVGVFIPETENPTTHEKLTWKVSITAPDASRGEAAGTPDTPGFYVYEPSTVEVSLECRAADDTTILKLPPQVLVAYPGTPNGRSKARFLDQSARHLHADGRHPYRSQVYGTKCRQDICRSGHQPNPRGTSLDHDKYCDLGSDGRRQAGPNHSDGDRDLRPASGTMNQSPGW